MELKYRRTKGLTAKYELGTVKTGTDNKRLGELGCEHAVTIPMVTNLQNHPNNNIVD